MSTGLRLARSAHRVPWTNEVTKGICIQVQRCSNQLAVRMRIMRIIGPRISQCIHKEDILHQIIIGNLPYGHVIRNL